MYEASISSATSQKKTLMSAFFKRKLNLQGSLLCLCSKKKSSVTEDLHFLAAFVPTVVDKIKDWLRQMTVWHRLEKMGANTVMQVVEKLINFHSDESTDVRGNA